MENTLSLPWNKEMSDQLLFQVSNEGQASAEPFIQKSVVYIIDQNNSSYSSGQIQIDTSSLSNSGKWASYSEAILQIPMVMTLAPTTNDITGWATAKSQFAAGIKAGFWQFLHSMSVEYNNSNVIQLTPYTNMYVHFKMLTSMSQDDAEKIGASIGFFKDTPDSFTWATAAGGSTSGAGSGNNRDFGFETLYPTINNSANTAFNGTLFNANTALGAGGALVTIAGAAQGALVDALYNVNYPSFGGSIVTTANFGFYRRQKLLSFDPTAAPYVSLLMAGTYDTMAGNYFYTSTDPSGAGAKVWRFIASIRLKDISDFFAQMPLVRGAYMRFIINTNLGTATLGTSVDAATASTPALTFYDQTAISITQGTMPVMFASSAPGQGAYNVCSEASKTLKLSVSIVRNKPSDGGALDTNTYTHPLTACRLYTPLYTMNPIAEAAYLEANPTKTIVYRDILNYLSPGVATDTSINALITNGVVNPKSIIIVPIFNSASNGGSGFSPHQSVFATEPGTTSPLCAVTNLNILVAGVTIFQLNQQYAWQQFVDEIQHQNAINGGQTTGLNSGLLSEYDWSQNYRYIVVDISRRIGSENAIPKSIQVLLQNKSAQTVDYFIFLEIERSLTISLINGQLVA